VRGRGDGGAEGVQLFLELEEKLVTFESEFEVIQTHCGVSVGVKGLRLVYVAPSTQRMHSRLLCLRPAERKKQEYVNEERNREGKREREKEERKKRERREKK
jgi:hypothetical protein